MPEADVAASKGEVYHDITVRAADGRDIPLRIRIADNEKSREQGLMFVREMPADEGMLFLFQDVAERRFWMKNTYIPLDMVFIDPTGKIVSLYENAQPHSLTPISSVVPAGAALELNGGTLRRLGIRVGDRIIHPVFQ